MSTGENVVEMPLVLRGSLITLRRKCGRPGCRCARGALHETPALSLPDRCVNAYSFACDRQVNVAREGDLVIAP
jgi:hypothetical protein